MEPHCLYALVAVEESHSAVKAGVVPQARIRWGYSDTEVGSTLVDRCGVRGVGLCKTGEYLIARNQLCRETARRGTPVTVCMVLRLGQTTNG